jgi:hypothetical protein
MPSLKVHALAWVLCGVATAAAQEPPSQSERYAVNLQIRPSSEVMITEEITFSRVVGPLEKELPIFSNDQMGNSWRIDYSNISLSLDGRPIRFEALKKNREMLLRLNPNVAITAPGERGHTLKIEYLASNAVRREEDWDTISKSFGGSFRIDSLDVHILLPPGVSADAVNLDASTDVTSISSKCICKVERSGSEIGIHVSRPLQVGEDLSFELRFKTGSLHRSLSARIELFRQNNHGFYSWGQFIGSLLVYFALAFAGMRAYGSNLSTRTTKPLLIASLAMAASSVLLAVALNQPEVAVPGTFLGILASMVLGGGAHGPSHRYLWIPLAFVINCSFYYLLWRVLQGLAGIRLRSRT